jgi:hypothetical protein
MVGTRWSKIMYQHWRRIPLHLQQKLLVPLLDRDDAWWTAIANAVDAVDAVVGGSNGGTGG